MGACLRKERKRTTKSKNFGSVNFVLNKHRVQNVVGTKNQKPKGSKSWRQYWVDNSGQDLPLNCLKLFKKKSQILGAHIYITEKKDKVTRPIEFIIPVCYGYLMSQLYFLEPLIDK